MPGGEPWVSQNGIELISYDQGVQSYLLGTELPVCKGFTYPMLDNRPSDQYFAITENSTVHVYKADRKTLHASYEMTGEICQLTIHEHSLYVVEQDVDEVCFLVVYDLLQVDPFPFHTVLPGEYVSPICFGKDHLIYVESFFKKDIPYALPLSTHQLDQDPWIMGIETEGILCYFPQEDHFIEVKFKDNFFALSKVQIENKEFIRTPITKEIVLLEGFGFEIDNVHFHNNRLFFSCEIPYVETRLFSYDIYLGRLIQLTSVPNVDEGVLIAPTFLSTLEKTYYISMHLISDDITCELITLTYGKI